MRIRDSSGTEIGRKPGVDCLSVAAEGGGRVAARTEGGVMGIADDATSGLTEGGVGVAGGLINGGSATPTGTEGGGIDAGTAMRGRETGRDGPERGCEGGLEGGALGGPTCAGGIEDAPGSSMSGHGAGGVDTRNVGSTSASPGSRMMRARRRLTCAASPAADGSIGASSARTPSRTRSRAMSLPPGGSLSGPISTPTTAPS